MQCKCIDSYFSFIIITNCVPSYNFCSAPLQIRQWSFSLGYTLCFGVILTKTWRIYNIFSNPTPKKKVCIDVNLEVPAPCNFHHILFHLSNHEQIPKDWLLFLIVFLVVLVDLTIVFIGTAIPTARLNATLVHDVQHPMSVDVSLCLYDVFSCM